MRKIPLSWEGVQAPPDIFLSTLSDELANALVLDNEYPVRIDVKPPTGYSIGAACLRGMPPGEQIRFYWSQEDRWYPNWIRRTYLHELAHVVAINTDGQWAERGGHGLPFAILLSILLRRSNAAIPAPQHPTTWDEVMDLSLYDVSSEPKEKWGWALQTAVDISADLAPRPYSIEHCAELVWRDWHRKTKRFA